LDQIALEDLVAITTDTANHGQFGETNDINYKEMKIFGNKMHNSWIN